MDALIIVTACIVLSLLMTEVFTAVKSSVVIGLILGGAFLGLPIFGGFITNSSGIIESISTFGVILLLFISGLQADYRKLKESRKEETLIAFLGAIIPFGLGFLTSYVLGYSNTTSFVVGSALSITSAGTTIAVLLETKKLNTKVGAIIVGAGIIDDIFEVIFLSILIVLVQHGPATSLLIFPFKILLFIIIVLTFMKLILPTLVNHLLKQNNPVTTIGFMIALCFVTALVSYFLDLGYLVGAFLAGIIIQLLIQKSQVRERIVDEIKNFSFAIIIPFFFINLGLKLNLGAVENYFGLFLIILSVAIIGKVGGALLAKPFTKLNLKQLHLIGWGMNSRGAVELVIVEIARNSLGLPLEIYSILILTAVTTTFIFPFILKSFVKNYPEIMDK